MGDEAVPPVPEILDSEDRGMMNGLWTHVLQDGSFASGHW